MGHERFDQQDPTPVVGAGMVLPDPVDDPDWPDIGPADDTLPTPPEHERAADPTTET